MEEQVALPCAGGVQAKRKSSRAAGRMEELRHKAWKPNDDGANFDGEAQKRQPKASKTRCRLTGNEHKIIFRKVNVGKK